jgi:hypothetical protein
MQLSLLSGLHAVLLREPLRLVWITADESGKFRLFAFKFLRLTRVSRILDGSGN